MAELLFDVVSVGAETAFTALLLDRWVFTLEQSSEQIVFGIVLPFYSFVGLCSLFVSIWLWVRFWCMGRKKDAFWLAVRPWAIALSIVNTINFAFIVVIELVRPLMHMYPTSKQIAFLSLSLVIITYKLGWLEKAHNENDLAKSVLLVDLCWNPTATDRRD